MGTPEQLLAHQLGDDHRLRLVRGLLRLEVGRPRAQPGHDEALQAFQALARHRGDRDHLLEHAQGTVGLQRAKDRRFAGGVDLVDEHEGRGRRLPHPLQHQMVLLCGLGPRLHDHQHDIRFRQGGHCVAHHAHVEGSGRLVDSRRIDQHRLIARAVFDAHDPVARGLRLAGRDGDRPAHQRVQQRRFAHVGPPHQTHEAGSQRCSRHAAPIMPLPSQPQFPVPEFPPPRGQPRRSGGRWPGEVGRGKAGDSPAGCAEAIAAGAEAARAPATG